MLYRLVSSGSTRGIRARRGDGVVRPLLTALARGDGGVLPPRTACRCATDATNAATKRGLIRERLLPLLEELDPRARANLLALAEERPRLPRAPRGVARRASLVPRGHAHAPTSATAPRGPRLRRAAPRGGGEWGPWRLESDRTGLVVRSRRPGDRLAGRSRKVQDVLVDAKVPRDERDAWPLVATEDGAVVAVAGLEEAPGWEGAVRADAGGRVTSVHADVGEVLIDEDDLRGRVEELGAEISADYEGRDLLLVGVLKGAIFFISDLMRELAVPCEIDFMAISSYGAGTDSSGVVRILKDLEINISGRDVLVVEDIIDSGLTLSYLRRTLGARKPASLEICALLTKPERREVEVPVRYVGFEIPNRFVIGYGLDFAERYRNLPYIGVLHPDLVPERRSEQGFSAQRRVAARVKTPSARSGSRGHAATLRST